MVICSKGSSNIFYAFPLTYSYNEKNVYATPKIFVPPMKINKGPSINVNIFMSNKPHPPKKSTHQHFLSAKNPHENNKNLAKKYTEKNVDFY